MYDFENASDDEKRDDKHKSDNKGDDKGDDKVEDKDEEEDEEDEDEEDEEEKDEEDEAEMRPGLESMGVSTYYVPSWGCRAAFRELYQNWYLPMPWILLSGC